MSRSPVIELHVARFEFSWVRVEREKWRSRHCIFHLDDTLGYDKVECIRLRMIHGLHIPKWSLISSHIVKETREFGTGADHDSDSLMPGQFES